MINVNSETFNTTQPKSRKQIRRKSAWSTVASVLQPDMINRLKAGFKPESTQHVNFYFHTIIFRLHLRIINNSLTHNWMNLPDLKNLLDVVKQVLIFYHTINLLKCV